jgi:uncharacterized protein involved in response to NO
MFTKFFSQPHQPFFASGIVLFIIFLLLIGAQYANIIMLDASLSEIHSYPIIFMIFIQFFLGFLFVVFPKFLTHKEIPEKEYTLRFLLFAIGSITYITSLFIGRPLRQVAILILIAATIASFQTLLNIYIKSTATNKQDTGWILTALFFGIISNILFFISTFEFSFSLALQQFSINAGFFLFLFALIFTIAQRMVPLFTNIKVQSYVINKSKYILQICFILLGLKVISLSLSNMVFSLIVDFSLVSFFTYEILKWKLPLFKTEAILWVLHLSLFWIPLGFLLFFLESLSHLLGLTFIFEKAPLHALALGYFLTILVGFGSRVTLGHSGRIIVADKITIALFIFIQGIVLLRIFAGFSLNLDFDYTFWISLSAFSLAFGMLLWSFKYLTMLIKGNIKG